MHIVDKNYIALFDHGIKMLVTYQLYILDPRFVPRLLNEKDGPAPVTVSNTAIHILGT